MSETYKGSCFCGEVEIEVSGAPVVMGYCHCDDCKSWLAAPMSAFTLWPPENVRVTKGEAKINTFSKSKEADRKYCANCGGAVMSDHPSMGLTDVFAVLLQGFAFEPAMHVHYGKKAVSIADGVPKFRDLPTDFGGSGDLLTD